MSSSNSDKVINILTVQSNAIRVLVEALKDILTDVNLQIMHDCLKIISMDGSKSAVVHLKLDSTKFETYYCEKNINAGINMASLHKIIKSIKNNDVILFYIYKNDITKLHIEIENKEKKTKIHTILKLLDIDTDIIEIPEIQFDSVITMPSNDFQNYIRELSILTNRVKIESNGNKTIFSGEGDFAETEIIVGDSENENSQIGNINVKNEITSASGTFNIKFLMLFAKSTNLCTTVEIYLKNNFPLILVYNVANLGKIKYCLVPLIDED